MLSVRLLLLLLLGDMCDEMLLEGARRGGQNILKQRASRTQTARVLLQFVGKSRRARGDQRLERTCADGGDGGRIRSGIEC